MTWLPVFLASFTALICVAAWWWVRLVVSACQWLLSCRPLLGRQVSSTCSLPGEGAADNSSPVQADAQLSSRASLLSSPPRAPLFSLPFAAALQPDFDAFFGGLEVVVTVGFVLVVALVMVLAARRFTNL